MTPTTAAVDALVAAVDAALGDLSLSDERARCEAMRGAMAALLADRAPIPDWAYEPLPGPEGSGGEAVGNLLYADPDERFHILAVVFPEGTSSGVHHHGCWGVIGYLRGGDEETRYRAAAGVDESASSGVTLDETSRHVWHQGDVTYLLPETGEGWHRVRNPGPGVGVSIHVLCRTPAEHPHRYWDRSSGDVLAFPFIEVAPDRWRATLSPPPAS